MNLAKAGQGSFYHHFRSKRQLAAEVLSAVSVDLLGIGREQLQKDAPPLERLKRYLRAERDAVKGCRLGRLAYDAGLNEPELREPTRRYFLEIESLLVELFSSRSCSQSSPGKPEDLAACTLAVIQGGYVLSRIHNQAAYMRRAVEGLWALLAAETRAQAGPRNRRSKKGKGTI